MHSNLHPKDSNHKTGSEIIFGFFFMLSCFMIISNKWLSLLPFKRDLFKLKYSDIVN